MNGLAEQILPVSNCALMHGPSDVFETRLRRPEALSFFFCFRRRIVVPGVDSGT